MPFICTNRHNNYGYIISSQATACIINFYFIAGLFLALVFSTNRSVGAEFGMQPFFNAADAPLVEFDSLIYFYKNWMPLYQTYPYELAFMVINYFASVFSVIFTSLISIRNIIKGPFSSVLQASSSVKATIFIFIYCFCRLETCSLIYKYFDKINDAINPFQFFLEKTCLIFIGTLILAVVLKKLALKSFVSAGIIVQNTVLTSETNTSSDVKSSQECEITVAID